MILALLSHRDTWAAELCQAKGVINVKDRNGVEAWFDNDGEQNRVLGS